MRILILDDDDVRHDIWGHLFTKAGHEVIHAHTLSEFDRELMCARFDYIFLDHDLNDYPLKYRSMAGDIRLTGKAACHWVAALPTARRPKRAVVHSWNEDEAPRMVEILVNAGIPTIRKEFPSKLWLRHPANCFPAPIVDIDDWEDYDGFRKEIAQ